jgi:hypothetical protein
MAGLVNSGEDLALEDDRFVGTEIRTSIPPVDQYVKLKFKNLNPQDRDREYLYCKIKKIHKVEVNNRIDYVNSYFECESFILQYFDTTRNEIIYEKYTPSNGEPFTYYLRQFNKWKPITDNEYGEMNRKVDNYLQQHSQHQSNPIINRIPSAPLEPQGGRRRSRKFRRRSRKSRRKCR